MSRIRLTRAAAVAAALLSVAVATTACSSGGKGEHAKTPTTHATTPATSSQPPSAPASTASALSGKWSGQYSGAYAGTFALHWHQKGSKLSGRIHISAPPGSFPIHGTVSGSHITFGTVGSLAITYSGTVSGTSMSGTYQVHGGSSTVGGPWSATKTS